MKFIFLLPIFITVSLANDKVSTLKIKGKVNKESFIKLDDNYFRLKLNYSHFFDYVLKNGEVKRISLKNGEVVSLKNGEVRKIIIYAP